MTMYAGPQADVPTGMGTPQSAGVATEQETAQAPAPEPTRSHRPPQRQTMLEEVANDLALWVDQTATEVALAFAPGRAPFAANMTESQKLDFYTRQLFNPDGSPNVQGRAQQVARLGVEQFAQVYQAVVRANPELKPPPVPPLAVPPMGPAGLPSITPGGA